MIFWYYVQYYPCRELQSSHVHVSMGQFSTTVMSCTLIHSICMERGWSSHCCSDSGMCMSVAFVDSFCYHNRVVLIPTETVYKDNLLASFCEVRYPIYPLCSGELFVSPNDGEVALKLQIRI